MGFVGCIPRFFKAHGGWILTALGVVGFGSTVILVANEAPEVHAALDDAHNAKYMDAINNDPPEDGIITDEWYEEHSDEMSLTFWEKVKIAFPYYIPAILTGTATAGCMIGAQIFNMRQQAMLVGAYAALATQFEQYREAVRAEHGEEADRRAFEISRMKIEELKEEIKRLKEENGPYLYSITTLPGVVFEAKPVDIQEALYNFNRNLILRGENSLSELYEFIGIPNSCYDEATADSFGYNEVVNETDYGVNYADFQIQGVFAKSGRMVNMIVPAFAPYRIDCCDINCDLDQFETYPDYDQACARAFRLAESVFENGDLTKIDHPVIHADNHYFLKA